MVSALPKLLTKSKRQWVRRTKPTASVRGTPLRYSPTTQSRYVSDMQKLMDSVIAETEKAVGDLFKSETSKEFFAQDASMASQARMKMNKLVSQVMKSVSLKAKLMADRMVTSVDKDSKRTLHHSLKELSGGLSIKTNIAGGDIGEAFTASVNANVDLIKTIPGNYLEQVKGSVNRAIQNGGGLDDIMPTINKFLTAEAKKVKNKAKNTALDQTRKAYNSLNAARMTKVGVKKFEWVASGGGQSPRPHHHASFPNGLNGGIYSLDELPVIDPKTGERGLPGTAINCKCVMRPVISFDEGEPVE